MNFPVNLPSEKPDAPLWLMREHGINCWSQDGQQYADSPNAQDLIDAYDPVPEAKAALKARIDEQQHARAGPVAGDDNTRWARMARMQELTQRRIDGTATEAEEAEMNALSGVWVQIRTILQAAAAMKAEVDGMSAEQVAAADPSTDPRWPAD